MRTINNKPRFKIVYYPPHSTYGDRILLDPINHQAHTMIRDRDAGRIKDFPLVVYQIDTTVPPIADRT